MEQKPIKKKLTKDAIKKKFEMKKGWKIALIIVAILIILLGIGAGIGVWYVSDKLGKVNYVEINENEIEINEGTNICLS